MQIAIALSSVIGIVIFAGTLVVLWVANILTFGKDSKIPLLEHIKAVMCATLAGSISGGLVFLASYDYAPNYIQTPTSLSSDILRATDPGYHPVSVHCANYKFRKTSMDGGDG